MHPAIRVQALVLLPLFLGAGASCVTERAPPPSVALDDALGPSTTNAALGSDYVDAEGRLWRCMGPAKFAETASQQEARVIADAPSLSYENMTEAELAEKIRPVRLVGGYEYRLAEPDYLLARRIRAMKIPPTTEPGPVRKESPAFDAGTTLKPAWLFPNNRANITSTNIYPSSPNGELEAAGFGCTTALIGRTTSITAAHCVYLNNAWLSPNRVAYAAYNPGTTDATATEPWGRWWPLSFTIPSNWTANQSDFTWDFALLEWGPNYSPGTNVSWFGTSWDFSSTVFMHGYSGDWPLDSQLFRSGQFSSVNGAEYLHYIDAVGGDSGACFYNGSYRCTCIQSTEAFLASGGGPVNACRRWDSATYNFFDTYAWNWP